MQKIKKHKKINQQTTRNVKKSYFWNAFSAISTAIAVMVALVYPIISNIVRTENTKYIINNEILDCHDEAYPLFSEVMYFDNPELSISNIVGISKRMNTDLWNNIGSELLISDPNSFLQFSKIYKSISYLKQTSKLIDLNKPFIIGDLDNALIQYVQDMCEYLESDEYIMPKNISITYTK